MEGSRSGLVWADPYGRGVLGDLTALDLKQHPCTLAYAADNYNIAQQGTTARAQVRAASPR